MSSPIAILTIQPDKVDISAPQKNLSFHSDLNGKTDSKMANRADSIPAVNWLSEVIEIWCSDLIEGAFFGPYDAPRSKGRGSEPT